MCVAFFEFGGSKIYYKTQGSGFPLLFVHGMLSNHESLEEFSKKLDGKFRTILVDLPGHGKSTGVITSVTGLVSALRSLLTFLGVHKYGCVGYSLGASLCSILNRLDPRVERTAVISPVVSDFRPLELWFSALIENFFHRRFSKFDLIKTLLLHGVSSNISLEDFNKILERAKSVKFVSIFYDALIGAQINTGLNLLYSHNPLLVVSGKYDVLSPPALVKKHLSSLAEFHTVNKGHADIFSKDLIKGKTFLLEEFFTKSL